MTCGPTTSAARVRRGVEGWKDVHDVETPDTGLGVHVADLPFGKLGAGQTVQFTFFWTRSQAWEGRDHEVLARQK